MLGELAEQGADTVSSEELAAATGVNSAKLRKDLSYIGSHGIRGVGYDVRALRYQLERVLGLDHRQAVALVGVGNLGHALAGYGGFGGRGFPVTALFDVDPDLVGTPINGIPVEHVRAIPAVCAERGVTIGMIATPGRPRRRCATSSSRPGCAASSTSRRSCCRCRAASRSARWTSPWSCRSSRSTSRAGPSPPPSTGTR
jgi:NADH/NAD ratio-sensing transcriptional regulator Rex